MCYGFSLICPIGLLERFAKNPPNDFDIWISKYLQVTRAGKFCDKKRWYAFLSLSPLCDHTNLLLTKISDLSLTLIVFKNSRNHWWMIFLFFWNHLSPIRSSTVEMPSLLTFLPQSYYSPPLLLSSIEIGPAQSLSTRARPGQLNKLQIDSKLDQISNQILNISVRFRALK